MTAEKPERPDGAAGACPVSSTRDDYQPSLGDRAMANIRGGTDAQRLLQVFRAGLAPADALHEALQLELATGDAERLRGFCREVQKMLERTVVAL